jgi:RimJ/RimL family protein N-acetyltransferase
LTPELILRGVEVGDLDAFFEHQRDPEATRMAAFPARERPAFDAHWRRLLADETAIVRTIVWNGEVAGNVSSWLQARERLVGYWIGRDQWGRGIATAALAAFLAEVAERPLRARVATGNRGSIRVLEKCGFQTVGEPEVGTDGIAEHTYELR